VSCILKARLCRCFPLCIVSCWGSYCGVICLGHAAYSGIGPISGIGDLCSCPDCRCDSPRRGHSKFALAMFKHQSQLASVWRSGLLRQLRHLACCSQFLDVLQRDRNQFHRLMVPLSLLLTGLQRQQYLSLLLCGSLDFWQICLL